MGLNKDGYYTLRDILGYNAKYNIILSDRGRGKSWSIKWHLLDSPGQFMAIGRQKPDMRMQMQDFLEPFIQGDSDHAAIDPERFEWQGSDETGFQLCFDGEVKGFFRYLTQVNHIKQEVFPDTLNWVWWDEFIPLAYKKLPGIPSEGDALRTIVKTIEHDTVRSRRDRGLKEVRVIMVANPFTWNNPNLSYFHINGLLGVGIHKAGPGVVWELLPPAERNEDRKLSVDDFLGDEVLKTMGFLDQAAFVKEVPKGAVPQFQLRFEQHKYVLYAAGSDPRLYVAKTQKEHPQLVRYGVLEGRQSYERHFDPKERLGKILREKCHHGYVFFKDINTKFDFLNDLFE